MITASVMHAIAESFRTAYGKNGLPWDLRIWYSRRYCSFSREFMRQIPTFAQAQKSGAPIGRAASSHSFLLQGFGQARLEPRRRRRAELRHQVEVSSDQGGDQARYQQHVDRIETR